MSLLKKPRLHLNRKHSIVLEFVPGVPDSLFPVHHLKCDGVLSQHLQNIENFFTLYFARIRLLCMETDL